MVVVFVLVWCLLNKQLPYLVCGVFLLFVFGLVRNNILKMKLFVNCSLEVHDAVLELVPRLVSSKIMEVVCLVKSLSRC